METDHDSGGDGRLDINDNKHMWVLHYVFIPRLNRDVKTFRNQWNTHGLRTQEHLTPLQVFVKDSLAQCNTTFGSYMYAGSDARKKLWRPLTCQRCQMVTTLWKYLLYNAQLVTRDWEWEWIPCVLFLSNELICSNVRTDLNFS